MVRSSTIRRATGVPRENSLDGAAIYRIALGREVQPDGWQQALMDDEWPQVACPRRVVAPYASGLVSEFGLGLFFTVD